MYYDLHIHSALSPCADNTMTINNILNMAYIKGLDLIALCDHNSLKQQFYLDKVIHNDILKGRIDYIHDSDAVEQFACTENAIGILMPSFDKSALFAFGATGHILPRKTFSLGHSREKRYYLEGRKIK